MNDNLFFIWIPTYIAWVITYRNETQNYDRSKDFPGLYNGKEALIISRILNEFY